MQNLPRRPRIFKFLEQYLYRIQLVDRFICVMSTTEFMKYIDFSCNIFSILEQLHCLSVASWAPHSLQKSTMFLWSLQTLRVVRPRPYSCSPALSCSPACRRYVTLVLTGQLLWLVLRRSETKSSLDATTGGHWACLCTLKCLCVCLCTLKCLCVFLHTEVCLHTALTLCQRTLQ